MRAFKLSLPDELPQALSKEATTECRRATGLVLEALVRWVQARKRQRVAEEIERFARAEARTRLDVDVDLEAAGIACLLTGEPG